MFDRRTVLLGAGTLAASSLVAGCSSEPEAAPKFFTAGGPQIGLQLYTLGEEAGVDLDATFAAVAAIGYREIELPNLYGKDASDIHAAADRAGVTITSLHIPPRAAPGSISIFSDSSELIDVLGALGVAHAVMPINLFPEVFDPSDGGFPAAMVRGIQAEGADLYRRTAEIMNTQASALKPEGIAFSYHNHNTDFLPVDGTNGWEMLVEETDPALIGLEVDTGWTSTAGYDVAQFITKYGARVTQLHVKDVAADNPVNQSLNMVPATVGAGALDWPAILAAAQSVGVQHYYLEQEPPFPGTRMEAITQGFDYLAGVEA